MNPLNRLMQALSSRNTPPTPQDPMQRRRRWRGAALTEFIIAYGAYALTLVVVVAAAAGIYIGLQSNAIQSDLRSLVQQVSEKYPGSRYSDLTGEKLAQMRTFPVNLREGACAATPVEDCAPHAGGLMVSMGPGNAKYVDATTTKLDIGAGGPSRFVLRVTGSSLAAAGTIPTLTGLDSDQCVSAASFQHPRLVGVGVHVSASATKDKTGHTVPDDPTANTNAATTFVWKSNVDRPNTEVEAACVDTTNAASRSVYLAFR